MTKVLALARITFWEGIRNRSIFGILLFALFVFGLNISVAGFYMRDIGKVTVDMNLSALSFAGLLLVFFIGTNLLSKDIDRKTIQLVLSRPISRAEYIFGKFAGTVLFAVVSLLVLLAFSVGTIYFLESRYEGYFHGFSWQVFILAVAFILMQVAVLSSLLIFFSSITTSSFVTLIFTLSAYVVGTIIEDVVFFVRSGLGETSFSPALVQALDVLTYIVPNFSVFDFKTQAAHGLSVATGQIVAALGYGVSYMAVVLVLAALIFRRREFH